MKCKRRLAVLALIVAVWNSLVLDTVGPQPLSTPDPLVAAMISEMSEARIYDTVYRLQNFTTRKFGSQGNVEAGTYLYDYLSDIPRLRVEDQSGDFRNVIATLPGEDPLLTAIFMVGAHYDSTSPDPDNAPGATDNGGGVAIVLEFARIMSQYRFRHTLQFSLWNNEEAPLIWRESYNYAEYARSSDLNIALYTNFDSSCYDPDNRFVLDIMHNDQSEWISDMMTQHNSLYDIDIGLTYNAHSCQSDHTSFWTFGYSAITTHAETHGPAHTTDDTVDKVNTLYAKKNGQLGLSVLATIAEVRGLWTPGRKVMHGCTRLPRTIP